MRIRTIGISIAGMALTALGLGCSRPRRDAETPQPARIVAALSPVERAVMIAAIDSIAAGWPDSTALCLRLLGGPAGWELPPRALLEDLHTRQQPVSGTECPRTYTSMILEMDSAGRPIRPPPGYVDPYILTVGRPQFESDSYGWVHVREWQGTAGREYLCTIQYIRSHAWAHCATVSRWIS